MAKTAKMKLVELMVLKQDISKVIEFIGKKGSFQFQKKDKKTNNAGAEDAQKILDISNADSQYYAEIKKICNILEIKDLPENLNDFSAPDDQTRAMANNLITAYKELEERISEASDNAAKVNNTYKEAMAFSNLQVSYSELEHLSFLSLKIGKIPSENFDDLKESLESNAIVVALGDDKSHILVASSRKGRFALNTELKNHGFVEMEVPHDFKGVPADVLESLKVQKELAEKQIAELQTEKQNFAETHKQIILKLIGTFAIGVQIAEVVDNLESTELVYRLTGWIPEAESESYMKGLDEITEGRIAIREFSPMEVPSVINGKEKVPVKLNHGKFISSFERMIFSYGSPVYGTVDPTSFVAVFFTILFGFMFGDLGQGLVFVLAGILMHFKIIKVGGWNKFAPIFIAIGCTSSVMGLLTGEFFSNETLLEPFAMWVTGLFGNPHAPILKVMPSSDPNSIKTMFGVFGVAVAVGFVINSIGLVINFINNIIRRKWADAFFGKNGLAGAVFFWYVVATVLRVVLAKHKIAPYDIVILAVSLFFAAFASPFERALNHEKPLFENGFGTYLISSVVEVIEVISGYLSNTVSFIRVGAFALSHAVLDYVIYLLTGLCGGAGSPGGIAVLIVGNALIVVLEGMIVAIQVIRLQYYEFFSKFFNETGEEFKPFVFEYK